MAEHLELGKRGEEIAVKYLKSLGYRIRGRNVHVGRRDEIDILAFDRRDGVLVFAEVKTRARLDGDFRPELNVDWRKRERLKHAARQWVNTHDYDGGYRIDLVCIAEGRVIDHLRELAWG